MTHERVTIDCDPATPGFACSYLRLAGEECAFVETYTTHAVPILLAALAAHGRRPEDVRWIVVTHAHLDHAGGAGALMKACPRATLLAHPRAARHLVDPTMLVLSATAVYGEERFRATYGTIEPIPQERVRALADGETFELGGATLQVFHTAGHANHHFVVHDPAIDTVFTGDTFGLVYPAVQARGRFALASTSPTNFDAAEARKSVDRVLSLGARAACVTHFGEVTDLEEVASQMHLWIDRAERWVDETSRSDEDATTATKRLETAWRDAIVADAAARGLDFGADELAALESDIGLNAQGLAYVAIDRRDRAAEARTKPPAGEAGEAQ